MNIYNINGNITAEQDAHVEIHDLAVLRGYGVFDFLRTYNKVPFHLKDHLKRLHKSASLLDMNYNVSIEELESRVCQTLEASPDDECNIRILVTGGTSSDNLMPAGDLQTIIIVSKINEMNPAFYSEGVQVTTNQIDRFIPGAKSINYIPGIMSLKEAKSRGAIEAIYKDKDGNLLEGTTSNLFVVIDGKIITAPEARILPGITRQVILSFAEEIAPVEIRNIHYDEVRLMQEAIITASNKEVIPVTQIDSIPIGSGGIGPISKQIMQRFEDYAQSFRN